MTFTLARPGFPLTPEGKLETFEALEGDSHLHIANPADAPPSDDDAVQIIMTAQTDDGSFEFYGTPNKRGFLGRIEASPIYAANEQAARTQAYGALASSLSGISLQLDIPLAVYQSGHGRRSRPWAIVS